VGWCNWQPDALQDAGNVPPRVHVCGSGPDWGEVYFYSGFNYTGKCSAVWIFGGTDILVADYAFVELNGWWANANAQWTQIRSFKLGGSAAWGGISTSIVVGNGATANPPPTESPYQSCTFTNTTTTPTGVPSYPSCPGNHQFGITSFVLSAQ
jgi:hypothetical protein